MTLRRANPDDLDEAMALVVQFYRYFGYPFDSATHPDMVRRFLSTEYLGSIWLLLAEGKSVGYLALTYGFTFEFGGRDAFVDEFFVADAYRNRGFGRLALQLIQQKMEELGLVALHLQTEHYNERAKRLYESIGFQDLKRSTLTWRPI